jgi:triphosphoribosyl-dephospho-CoA synthase
MAMRGEDVAAAFREACQLELRALKPGNIGLHGEARGMTVADFQESADAAAPVMARSGIGVGRRILDAIEATRGVVSHNTNLGIVLLAAPLAQAALDPGGGDLRGRLERVLGALTVEDSRLAYRAILMAEPGGLDVVGEQDVRAEPTVDLRAAMAMADPRDRVAMQYACGFSDVFDDGLPVFTEARSRVAAPEWATTLLYMHFLARFADGLIARKYGSEAAEEVKEKAAELGSLMSGGRDPEMFRDELLEFDAWLKERRLNPGATADLVVATLFAARLASA